MENALYFGIQTMYTISRNVQAIRLCIELNNDDLGGNENGI